MDEQWRTLRNRIRAFYDPTAWALIIICGGGVWLFDPVLSKTLAEWCLLFGLFAGVAVIISRHVFPQVSLSDCVDKALTDKNLSAGIIVAGICVFMSFLILSLTIWGKG